ncbi:apoptotic protease-activating factor 1-like isoform X2 [Halichondria panicea]|uniref:apoptotic protease-activating factor 1-like isoform X2 n=1 Tax=Halichondria panicea TaxID=6063 RepID=UPI00312BBCC9
MFSYGEGVLKGGHHATLRAHREAIVSSLSGGCLVEILPKLVANGVINTQDMQKHDAEGKDTVENQAKHLLYLLEERDSSDFTRFVRVLLSSSEKCKEIGQLLSKESGVMDDEKYVKKVTEKGRVPLQPKVYLERKGLIEKIRNELRKMANGDTWLVVHGMGGTGKTVLTAEAVRDADLLRTVFPGGVNWFEVGHMADHHLDKAKLLDNLVTLILRLDENVHDVHIPRHTVEAAADYLQNVMSKSQKSLLILEDVWSPEVAKAFSACRNVIITSRNAAIASEVQTRIVHNISVSEDLTDTESRVLMGSWLNADPSSLSTYVGEIVKYCRGSPMAIGLICPILKRKNTETRWKEIAAQLATKALVLRASTKENKKCTLNGSIELSVNYLPPDLKSYFEMFVVLDYGTVITGQALSTMWDNEDIFETEDIMEKLVEYSMAQLANPGEENQDALLYQIHDLFLDYLKHLITEEQQMKIHARVVERYHKKCHGEFAELEDDNYIFQNLLSHVAAAESNELLGNLMTQLKWLLAVAQHGGANTYLSAYDRYRSKIPTKFMTSYCQFERFLSEYMFMLAHRPSSHDVIQQAILLPHNNIIRKQALGLEKPRKNSFFQQNTEWSGTNENNTLKLKIHKEGVSECCYSQDQKNILSCGGNEVKLWHSTNGIVLADFRGHTDQVTCCDLLRSGKLAVSSSEDNTVKVWDVRKKTVVQDFKGHEYGVTCCAFSPDETETLVVSADVDCVVMLWYAQTGRIRCGWHTGALSPANTPTESPTYLPIHSLSRSDSQAVGEAVMACAFSPSGETIATGSMNGIVRIWNLAGELQSTFTGHTSHIRSCVFSQDGKLLATASLDHTARVWTVEDCNCDTIIRNDTAVFSCNFLLGDSQLLTGDFEGSVKMWSLPEGRLLRVYPAHSDYVNCVLYSPTMKSILSAADNGVIKIMCLDETDESGSKEETDSHSNTIYHRRFSASFIEISASTFEPLIVCYVTKEKKMQVLYGTKAEIVVSSLPLVPEDNPRCWVISNKGLLIAVGYKSGTIQLLSLSKADADAGSGCEWSVSEVWRRKQAHEKPPFKIYFSPSDEKLISCSSAGHKAWNVKDGHEISSSSGRGLGVRPCVFFSDNVRVASAADNEVLVWDADTGITLKTFATSTKDGFISCISLSVDNTRIAISNTEGLVMAPSA